MSLDDALTLAGQVLTDYAASGLPDPPVAERVWPDRLAHALGDLSAAAAAWYAAPAGDPSAAALADAVRRLEDSVTEMEAQAARLDRAAELAARHAARGRPGRVRDALARLVRSWAARAARRVPEPDAVALSAAEADTAWQALADAAAWRAGQTAAGTGCSGCVRARANAHGRNPELARCPVHAREGTIAAEYAALRIRLGGDRR
jgi:hypothetical protein